MAFAGLHNCAVVVVSGFLDKWKGGGGVNANTVYSEQRIRLFS